MKSYANRGDRLSAVEKKRTQSKAPWREPLVHLFVLGFVVFGLHAVLNRETASQEDDLTLIEISSADLDWFQTMWTKRMGRIPDALEIRGQIHQLIRELILEREARNMGLDQDDTVVRRRLSQKMDFLFQDLGSLVEPNEAQLRDYYDQNSERYQVPGHVTFTQICFNGDRRGMEQAFQDANELLTQLQSSNTPPDQATSLGDATMLPATNREQRPAEVENQFGAEFQEAIQRVPTQRWQGPIASGFGQHLVFVHARTESTAPPLEAVRNNVGADWLSNQQRLSKQLAYLALRQKYQVLVEGMPYEGDTTQ